MKQYMGHRDVNEVLCLLWMLLRQDREWQQ